MEIQRILRDGFDRHQRGDLDGALDCYRRVLAQAPRHADALHLSGLIAHARGDSKTAVASIRAASALLPHSADIWSNLSAAELAADDAAAALEASERAIACNAQAPLAHAARAAALVGLSRIDAAADAYRTAIALAPANPDPLNNLANLEQRRGNLDAAMELYERVLKIAPEHQQAHSNYGTALYAKRRLGGSAVEAVLARARAWRAAYPGNAIAQHWHAALTQDEAPVRADDAYVRSSFDMFAKTFETTLAGLGYRAPQAIDIALKALLGPPARALDILDVGCGTGLAAAILRPYARRLAGVDLSPGMLALAQRLDRYDELRTSEAMADMRAHASAYDLAVAADVFVYFGDLVPLFAAAAICLRAEGRLVFTLEAMPQDNARAAQGWAVRVSGRYMHTRAHAEAALAAAGFVLELFETQSFRREDGIDLPGFLVAAKRS
jgi:predicted TPR repeat methyltransferase